jgi:phosphonate transport system substrate-binding protein
MSVISLAFCLLLLPACSSEESIPPERPKTKEPKHTDKKIVLAIHPYASPMEIVKQFTPLLWYLQKRTDLSLTLSVSKDYETHMDQVGSGKVDIALMGPASYVAMADRYGAKELLCNFEVNGSPYFHGYIITRKDNPATSIKDLVGKSFASSSRNSTMSYILPRYMFIQAGVPFPEAHLQIVRSHNNVCLNILAGDVNAGGVREKAYLKYRNKELKIIATSPEIREHLFVATGNLNSKTLALIRDALFDIRAPEEAQKLLMPIKSTLTALVAVEDKDYDELRTIIRAVRQDELRGKKLEKGER